jgi:hypothetical protein
VFVTVIDSLDRLLDHQSGRSFAQPIALGSRRSVFETIHWIDSSALAVGPAARFRLAAFGLQNDSLDRFVGFGRWPSRSL